VAAHRSYLNTGPYTGGALGYNLSMSIFGGLTPFLTLKIYKLTNLSVLSACILIFASLLSLISLVILRIDNKELFNGRST
jgi:hypothetical protein